VRTRCQPIAIRDVLAYLVGVQGRDEAAGRVFEIGGPDVVTYAEMMDLYADVAGLRRRVVVPVPLLTPRLSSYWVGLVTPLPAGLARPLIDSLENEVIVPGKAHRELSRKRGDSEKEGEESDEAQQGRPSRAHQSEKASL